MFKFNDLNGNGLYEPNLPNNEPLLPNWTFNVSPGSPTQVTTGSTGGICFGVPAPGTHTISEVLQLGWTPTTSTSQTVTVAPSTLTSLFFGNRKWCTVENIFHGRPSDIAQKGQTFTSWIASHPVLRLIRAWRQGLIDLPLFYRVRDEILTQTPDGQRYIDLFYEHDPEILGLLLADPALWDEAEATLLLWEPNLRVLVDGQGHSVIITGGQVQAVQDFLDHLSAAGSVELQQVIADERARLDPLENFVGMTVEEGRNVVIGRVLYLPLVVKQ